MLAHYGYVPNADQTVRALLGIRLTASRFPAIPFTIGVILLFFYRISRGMEFAIQDELAERRRHFVLS